MKFLYQICSIQKVLVFPKKCIFEIFEEKLSASVGRIEELCTISKMNKNSSENKRKI